MEDEDRQTCEMVLKKVECPYEGCDWVRKFFWSPAIADMPPEVTEACQHMYDVHDIYTMPPRVEEAEPPKEDRWTCKRVPEMVTLAWLVPRLHQYAAEDWLDPRTETCRPAEDILDPPEREEVAAAAEDHLDLQWQEGVVTTAREWLDPPEQEVLVESATAEIQPNRRGQLETAGDETETDETRIVRLETVEMKAETNETRIVTLETVGNETETDETGIVELETVENVTETDETVVKLETVRPETGETAGDWDETFGRD